MGDNDYLERFNREVDEEFKRLREQFNNAAASGDPKQLKAIWEDYQLAAERVEKELQSDDPLYAEWLEKYLSHQHRRTTFAQAKASGKGVFDGRTNPDPYDAIIREELPDDDWPDVIYT